MEAVAKYDFEASSTDQLSFRKGDTLKILSSGDTWYTAEMHGQEGFVPQNYLDVQMPRWFQENASRSFAEELLIKKSLGHFLIRGCQSSPGDFSISVRHEEDVQHFKVIKDHKGHYFLWEVKFGSFNKLVDYYKTNSISKQRPIFLKDGTTEADSRSPVTVHRNVGVVIGQEPTNPYAAAGRQNPVVAVGASVAKPQRLVRAKYDFKAEEDDELGFREGDLIEVLDESHALWWRGRLDGQCKRGLFPANYTMPK